MTSRSENTRNTSGRSRRGTTATATSSRGGASIGRFRHRTVGAETSTRADGTNNTSSRRNVSLLNYFSFIFQ